MNLRNSIEDYWRRFSNEKTYTENPNETQRDSSANQGPEAADHVAAWRSDHTYTIFGFLCAALPC